MRDIWAPAGMVLPSLLLLGVFFIVPVVAFLARSVLEPKPGFENYETLLGSTTYLRVFYNTFFISALVTVVTVAIGFPVAWALAIMPNRIATIIFMILILSMWTSLLARTFAWMVLLQRTGAINQLLLKLGLISEPLTLVKNLTGVIIGMTYIMLPFIILPLYGTIRKINPAILQAAALCGASRWQSLRLVLIPLAGPGLAAGALMIFVMSLGYYVTPSLLGGTSYIMLAELVAQLVQTILDWGLGSSAAFILLAVTLILYVIQLKFFGMSQIAGR